MVAQIRPADFSAWLLSLPTDAAPVVLDVREPWELQTASIQPAGCVLQAIPMNDIPARLPEISPNQPIACLCHHGMRSQRVAGFLAQQGFTHVVNIAGGIHAWAVELDPSVPLY